MGASSEITTAITEARRRFMDSFRAGDMTSVTGCFAEDAQMLQPNRDTLRGRMAIEGFWAGIRDLGARSLELDSAEIESVGDAAWEAGQYVTKFGDGTVVDRGKYMVIWRRSGNGWHFHRFMSNTNLAMPV